MNPPSPEENDMKTSTLISLAVALIALSGCIAYPMDGYPPGGEHGAQRDRGHDQDHDQRDDRHHDDRDRRPDCDPRASDCSRH
jgi:hypothetical protein